MVGQVQGERWLAERCLCLQPSPAWVGRMTVDRRLAAGWPQQVPQGRLHAPLVGHCVLRGEVPGGVAVVLVHGYGGPAEQFLSVLAEERSRAKGRSCFQPAGWPG